MENWCENLSVISKLKVGGNQLDALATRLYFERLFTSVNFHPPGISQKTIVCIKKLNAPTLKKTRSDFVFEWETVVRNEIEKLFRRAFYPISEAVPEQAESIVFADNAELLACLASDWCNGILAERWWWRGLFPNLYLAQTVAKIWIESAEFAPSAFRILSKMGQIIRFIKKLQPNETNDLLREIVRVFGLKKLEAALFEPFEKKEKFEFLELKKSIEKQKLKFGADWAIFSKTFSIWRNQIPEMRTFDLSFEQQNLLGIGLLISRLPKIVRSSEFARQIKIVRLKNEFDKTVEGVKIDEKLEKKIPQRKKIKPSNTTSKIFQNDIEEHQKPPESSDLKTQVIIDENDKKERKFDKKLESKVKKISDLPEKPTTEFGTVKEIKESTRKIRFEDEQSSENLELFEKKKNEKVEKPTIQTDSKKELEKILEDFETESESNIETRYGGVFYFLNLALFLQLYGDFTETLETEIELNIWEFVALLGFEFLGEKVKNDPIWDFLKSLAGHENDEEFGLGFNPADEWRIPQEWLETFQADRKWFWKKLENRLIIRHPKEFCIVDVKIADDAHNQLTQELACYEKSFDEVAEADSIKAFENLPPLEKWVKNLSEFVKSRLRQALNLKTSKEINKVLFERKAQISLMATHLEITFGLADLPFEVRLSGIDRNPGWIPAAGKFVYFHFV